MRTVFALILLIVFIWGLASGCRLDNSEFTEITAAEPELGIEIDKSIEDIVWDSDTIANMSDAQLWELVYSQPRIFIPDLYTPELFSVPFFVAYEIVENEIFDDREAENEWWWSSISRSYSSEESARESAIDFAMKQRLQDPFTFSCEFIGENDYFYQYQVKFTGWPNEDITYTGRLVFFKDSAVTLQAAPVRQETIVHNTEAGNVLNLLDLFLFFRDINNFSVNKIHREFHESDNEFHYIFYTANLAGGDYGTYDGLSLKRTVWTVDKASGLVHETEQSILMETLGKEIIFGSEINDDWRSMQTSKIRKSRRMCMILWISTKSK